jgi:hypothetical protein
MKRVMDLSFPVWSRLSLAAFALVLMAPAGHAALGQQAAAKPQSVSASGASQPTAAQTATGAGETNPAKPGHEGIAVHGHWVIDVRNPDGSLAQHREFENSLNPTGQKILTGLLGSANVLGDWAIVLTPESGNGPCSFTYTVKGGGTTQGCEIVRVLTTQPAVNDCVTSLCSTGLTYTVNTTSIVLAGTVIANQTGTIGNVFSEVAYCTTVQDSTLSPAACVPNTGSLGGILTGTQLATPISVTAGQQIQASVTISFS